MDNTGRINNVIRNMRVGVLQRLIQIFVPFLMRTLLIYTLGVEYVGLNSLFVSVLQVLSLAELGVYSAMNYAMYKPVAEKDEKKICALLREYRKYHFYIGLVILILGLVLIPFLPYLVNKDVPSDINIYVLYILYLSENVLSYWMFTYRGSLFEVHQRKDITSKIHMVLDLVKYILQFIVVILYRNYYAYIIIQVLSVVVYQLALWRHAKKIYPNYEPVGELEKKDKVIIKQRIKDLVTSKLGAVILTSSDSLIISAFLGLSVLAIYQNYFFLITSVIGCVGMALSGAMASVGNSIVTESRDKVYKDFTNFNFILSWLTSVCTCCFLCLFQPFMEIWMGKDLMLSFSIVILLCIYYYMYEFNQLFNIYKDAAGLWHEDRFRPLITSLTNLTLNIILVQFIGLYGVILSTVLSMLFVGMPWLIHNVFTCLFQRDMKEFLKRMAVYVIATVAGCTIAYFICKCININPIINLMIRAVVAVTVPSAMYLLIFHKTEECSKMFEIIKKVLKVSPRS